MRTGAWQDAKGTHLGVLSRQAQSLQACLIEPETRRILHEVELQREGDYWSASAIDWPAGSTYGFRVGAAHPGELTPCLLDPMARWVNLDRPDRPLAVLVEELAPARRRLDDRPAAERSNPLERMRLLYELHPRGFSQLQTRIPEALRGSIEALAHPWSIEYFQKLGVTTLCLMPISAHVDEPRLLRLGLSNYWGYNVLAWSAPHQDYLAACREVASGGRGSASGTRWRAARLALRETIAALHAAGLEVVLDVVYNHSAELDAAGPTYHLRALDAALHYRFGAHGGLQNWSGCGNTLNFAEPGVCAWVLQSLRHWVLDYGVDGFRFDLATTVSRNRADGGIDPLEASYFWRCLAADPVLAQSVVIAEPWDLGPQGYRLGGFPAQVLEWNDRYRDEMRGFWIREDAPLGRLADRLAGSSAIFAGSKSAAAASVNYLASHDGFTLHDALSYSRKHNASNGEDNRDGHDDPCAHNHGHEGPDAPPEVLSLRRRKHQALLACLFVSLGTPMLQAGDEWGRSQRGNNNAYCQDNELSWLRWDECDEALLAFARTLMQARKRLQAHLGAHWWREPAEDPRCAVQHPSSEARWLHPRGYPLRADDWESNSLRALSLQLRRNDHEDARALLLINGQAGAVEFVLPTGQWVTVFDSAATPLGARVVRPGYSVVCAVETGADHSGGAC